MKLFTKQLMIAILFGGLFIPLYASAQGKATTTEAGGSEARMFTACSQEAIELRDSAISSARTAYNNQMTVALDARKEAEKEAVALADQGDKKTAIKTAVEDYKKAVAQAQGALVKARKEAWSQFEANMKACREGASETSEKKDALVEMKSLQSNAKAQLEADKEEAKSLKDALKEQLESLKNFFKKGAPAAE